MFCCDSGVTSGAFGVGVTEGVTAGWLCINSGGFRGGKGIFFAASATVRDAMKMRQATAGRRASSGMTAMPARFN